MRVSSRHIKDQILSPAPKERSSGFSAARHGIFIDSGISLESTREIEAFDLAVRFSKDAFGSIRSRA